MEKKCQVIKLEINKKNNLYIISNDEIKERDWCIMLDDFGNIFSNPQQYLGKKANHHLNKGLRKIIATTDNLLIDSDNWRLIKNKFIKSLPNLPKEFIEHYIECYNKGEIITDILVEYESKDITETMYGVEFYGESEAIVGFEEYPKINNKNNTIIIKAK